VADGMAPDDVDMHSNVSYNYCSVVPYIVKTGGRMFWFLACIANINNVQTSPSTTRGLLSMSSRTVPQTK